MPETEYEQLLADARNGISPQDTHHFQSEGVSSHDTSPEDSSPLSPTGRVGTRKADKPKEVEILFPQKHSLVLDKMSLF